MHQLAADSLDRPVILVFIMKSCPCSTTAQPFFNTLWQAYQEKARFLGVIDSDMTEAKAWQMANKVPFPLLPDPKESVIGSYKAEHSAYSASSRLMVSLRSYGPAFPKRCWTARASAWPS